MGQRRNAYVNFKSDGVSIDFRVFAPYDTPLDDLKKELSLSYSKLLEQVGKKWAEEKTVPEPVE